MTRQLNLKIPDNLFNAAKNYAENYGFRNIQDLATECMREKIFEENAFDENFTDNEIELIDKLIEKSIKKSKLKDERELMKCLE